MAANGSNAARSGDIHSEDDTEFDLRSNCIASVFFGTRLPIVMLLSPSAKMDTNLRGSGR